MERDAQVVPNGTTDDDEVLDAEIVDDEDDPWADAPEAADADDTVGVTNVAPRQALKDTVGGANAPNTPADMDGTVAKTAVRHTEAAARKTVTSRIPPPLSTVAVDLHHPGLTGQGAVRGRQNATQPRE